MKMTDWLWQRGIDWLNATPREEDFSALCNFEFLEREIRPADVILFAGQTRVSKVIQTVALSPWTHAALYVGRINDIRDPKARSRLAAHYDGDLSEPLVIESLLGKGTIVTPLRAYRKEHLRLCRPATLTWQDTDKVVDFAIEHLGMGYDVRQLLDLARFMFPYAILPRYWRSTLFQHNAGQPTHIVCSSMIARCFQQVHYPILPIIKNAQQDQVRYYERNFRLFTPSDFDYSPYFTIIKYPAWNAGREPAYRTLPWHQEKEESHELANPLPSSVPQPPRDAPDEATTATDFADRTGCAGERQRLVGLRTFFRQTGLVSFARSFH
ncbi:MAG: hypothetical protein BWK73_47335 [Thiothrix lacustris]|uniref:Lipo-like protein n=1 Tax=Thiothrix lacustris TaxID=525917 RepID=A0A1Y1Q9V6_9GAMM|nr:MAG: hypothetical protein BWK73_47335 [Thiothrix lacustris]